MSFDSSATEPPRSLTSFSVNSTSANFSPATLSPVEMTSLSSSCPFLPVNVTFVPFAIASVVFSASTRRTGISSFGENEYAAARGLNASPGLTLTSVT